MTIPLSQRFEILQRDQFTCRFCGQRAPETELEVDHLHPRSKGGSDESSNLVTACRNCNRGKGDRVVVLPLEGGWSTLVGKFFHTFKDYPGQKHRIREQGVVLADLRDGYFMVQLFEWISGGPSFLGKRIATIAEMAADGWAWYASDESMRESYRYSGAAYRDIESNGHAVAVAGEDEP